MSQKSRTRGERTTAALCGRPKTDEDRAAISEGVRRSRDEIREAVAFAKENAECAQKLLRADPDAAHALIRSALANLRFILAKHGSQERVARSASATPGAASRLPAPVREEGGSTQDGREAEMRARIAAMTVVERRPVRVDPNFREISDDHRIPVCPEEGCVNLAAEGRDRCALHQSASRRE